MPFGSNGLHEACASVVFRHCDFHLAYRSHVQGRGQTRDRLDEAAPGDGEEAEGAQPVELHLRLPERGVADGQEYVEAEHEVETEKIYKL